MIKRCAVVVPPATQGDKLCAHNVSQYEVRLQKRPMGLEIEAPTPDKYEKGAGRLEGGTA